MRRVQSGRFEVNLAAQEAIKLFTPEGEKDWVPGWNPTYPAGEPSETPGTVFITAHGSVETIWVIQAIDPAERRVAYSRVTPRCHAGTVQVSCQDAPDGGCVVSVTYDMSLLPGGDPTELDAYEDGPFETMISDWSRAISHSSFSGWR